MRSTSVLVLLGAVPLTLTTCISEQPRAPLIEGLLEKVEDLDGETDSSEASDLNDTVNVLYQTALVKSGFNIPDPNA